MFLANLDDRQKPAFLTLAKSVIAADGVLADEEMLMMEAYQQEMSLIVPFNQIQLNETEALSVFESSAAIQKKQIFFELTALAYADQKYAEEEHIPLAKIAYKIGLDAEFHDKCRKIAEKAILLYAEIGSLISD